MKPPLLSNVETETSIAPSLQLHPRVRGCYLLYVTRYKEVHLKQLPRGRICLDLEDCLTATSECIYFLFDYFLNCFVHLGHKLYYSVFVWIFSKNLFECFAEYIP